MSTSTTSRVARRRCPEISRRSASSIAAADHDVASRDQGARLLGGRLDPVPSRQGRVREHLLPRLPVLATYPGAWFAEKLIGHGPSDIHTDGIDEGLLPVGPGSWVTNFETGEKQILVLGADGSLGRDEFLRLLYGGRVSLQVAVASTILVMLIGVTMGAMAGYYRGTIDTVVSRLTEITMAFPALLFVIALASTAGSRLNEITFGGVIAPGVVTLVLVFAVFGWFYPARIVRAKVLSLREKEFVEAALMTGASDFRIMQLAPPAAPRRADHRLLDARRRRVHPRRGGALVPRRRDPAADAELGQPALDGTRVLHDPAAAHGLARPRRRPDARSRSTFSATAFGTRSIRAPGCRPEPSPLSPAPANKHPRRPSNVMGDTLPRFGGIHRPDKREE